MSTAPATAWHRTDQMPPPEGKVVDTLSEGGQQQKLKRQGRLWFFPDGSMYVYYTPKLWREIEQATGQEGGGR